mmetsp:Transcript_23687/g.33943  ORF Transcript_23687/g.33943 Transcript_23687/m.33943 type:complete len:663 (+) Transcript_23687:115-2103(+)|eukprot:CAMPEP_0202444076 /NCGR_PEP_ID=MMETSP1360-20130828/3222_1 /ASSEMBLY_ACC=CAM_ASM_000848 /TAXON_ID=515479 /ORGANISM="Licmophora paradoxa, Strain CCMP2313" /LENGTH=662 /DNA_ID=CAMNT_0049059961 /DNA_START=128 /DNA_END=2116 /DNA_ORIENTATION=+
MAEIMLMPSASQPSRARELLKEMKAKRESLLSSHPELQRRQSLRKRPSLQRTASNRSNRETKDIITDMKKQKASLSAVLDAARKNNPPRKGHGSIAPSTAPTAASTRSFVDDASLMMYSVDGSQHDSTSVNESTFEFVIDADADDSTYVSTSTNEDIRKAVGDIYSIVIPKALFAIQSNKSAGEDELDSRSRRQSSTVGSNATTTTTLNRPNATLRLDHLSTIGERDTERETSEQETSQDEREKAKALRKKKHNARGSSSSESSKRSTAAETRDMLRKSLADLKSMRKAPPLRMHRPQSDESEGSLPPPSSRPSSYPPSRQGSRQLVPRTRFNSVPANPPCPTPSTSSDYVLGTKFRRGRRRKVVAKPATPYQGIPSFSPGPSRSHTTHRSPSSPAPLGNRLDKPIDPSTPELKDEVNSFEDKLDAAIRELQAPIVIDLATPEPSPSPSRPADYEQQIANAIRYVKEPKKLDPSPKKSPSLGKATTEFERRIAEAIRTVKVPEMVDMSPEFFNERPCKPPSVRKIEPAEEPKPRKATAIVNQVNQFTFDNMFIPNSKDAFEGKIIDLDLDGTDIEDDLTWGYSLMELPDVFNAEDVYHDDLYLERSPSRGVDDSASITGPQKKKKKSKKSKSKKTSLKRDSSQSFGGGLYFIAVQSGMEGEI